MNGTDAKYIQDLFNICFNILSKDYINANDTLFTDLKNGLNSLFPYKCIEVFCTPNTDKPFFGVIVDPVIDKGKLFNIIANDSKKVEIKKYKLEFDSKLFGIGLSPEELAALIVFEISSMMNNKYIDDIRSIINLKMIALDTSISLRDIVNYYPLIILALKDSLYKLSSIMYKNDLRDITDIIREQNLIDFLASAREKIYLSPYDVGTIFTAPKLDLLEWVLGIYTNIVYNSFEIKTILEDLKSASGSCLKTQEIDNVIDYISTAKIEDNDKDICDFIDKRNVGPVLEISLFKNLKRNGLRSIEDSLYEYSMMIKNCETEDDAMYIMRCIGTRLNILDDYIYNTPDMNPREKEHWEMVANKYRELREILVRKKIANKKQYGLFFDYDQLDYLDKKED